MGAIQQSRSAGESPTGTTPLAAQTDWSLLTYRAINAAQREAVQQEVRETQAITDEQVLLFVAPFLTESTRLLGNHLLVQQERTMTQIAQLVAEYQRRSQAL